MREDKEEERSEEEGRRSRIRRRIRHREEGVNNEGKGGRGIEGGEEVE